MRHGLALLLVLAPALVAVAQSSDPAYVDSPQSKAVPDPARADGGVGLSAESRQHAEHAQLARSDAERMAQVERDIQAQIERINAQQAAQSPQQDAAGQAAEDPSLPPIGGYSLLREVRDQRDTGLSQDTMGVGRAGAGAQRRVPPIPGEVPAASPMGGP